MRPVLAGERPFAIAHRGSRTMWPENTLEAFAGAHDLGYRWFETDLHLSSDGVVVCLHDDTLDRTTAGTGPVWDHSVVELEELDVPTLDAVLTRFPDVRMVVDLKQDGLAGPLWQLIERRGVHDRFIVGSFSDRRLVEFREVSADSVATSAGPRGVSRAIWGPRARGGLAFQAIQVPVSFRGIKVVTPTSIERAHRRGLQVHVWTVNASKQMHRLLDMGVDGLITDRVDTLKAVLIERGQWTGE